MKKLLELLKHPLHIETLAGFRVIFGSMLFISTLRFMVLGWIDDQYVNPIFHFRYYGFEWLPVLGRTSLYFIHYSMLFLAFFIIIGFKYNIATFLYFILFTYCELIDLTYYLNHYYFISILCLAMSILPASAAYSLDVFLNPKIKCTHVPAWTIYLPRFLLGIVYFYAGIAKLNSNWLIDAMPLKIWLPAQSHLPLIGFLFEYKATAYLFSWLGALFDLSIPFIMLSRFWWVGYICIVLFHTITGIFFPIGMFPIIMMFSVTIFFPEKIHISLWKKIKSLIGKDSQYPENSIYNYNPKLLNILKPILLIFISFQLLFPFRYLLYPGDRFWTEQGYRFGWRVMLMEKAGTAEFFVKDGITGKEGVVDNREFLNNHQEKQMAMQPDMILQYAHFLADTFSKKGVRSPQIRAEVWVTLNGKPSSLLIDPNRNLCFERESFKHKNWLLPSPYKSKHEGI